MIKDEATSSSLALSHFYSPFTLPTSISLSINLNIIVSPSSMTLIYYPASVIKAKRNGRGPLFSPNENTADTQAQKLVTRSFVI